MLEACNNNLELAIDMHMEGGAGNSGLARSEAAATAGPSSASSSYITSEVRAPIPQKEETLVEETPVYGFRGRRRTARSVFDGFRDFETETRQQEAMRSVTRSNSKRKTLEDLFRPPIDMIHKGSFTSARDSGTTDGRWLMVNVQNVQEFACQALNRDVWSNSAVKAIIKQHFVFWQVYHDSEEGRKYMQFYKITTWPYVAVLDPRTGENMAVWNKLDNVTFCDLVTEFLALNPSLDGLSKSPPAKKTKRQDSIVDASEDDQMMAAIQASLEDNSKSKPNCVTIDSDSSEDEELETFTDSDDVNSNPSPVKKPRVSRKKSPIKKDSLCSKLTNSANSCSSANHKNSAGKKCAKRRRSSEKEEEKSAVVVEPERWRNYLGDEGDSQATLMFRYPDGSREQLAIPHTSQLWALVYFVIGKGYSNEQYELVTQFPRRRISDLDLESTLQQNGLHTRETVFVQAR
ncbi:UBX domain-containing protein 7-like isoform X2 [Liolophura sinensis]|uniref:UBX domain-containing protein 7-like isoform X2 n=1 Tax=Liolophura sinensis TaxID=3198878 RepID=UPI00315846CE